MKIVRFLYRDEPRYGLVNDDHIEVIQGEPFDNIRTGGVSVALAKARLLAPANPTKIVAVGLNYRDHARELNMEIPESPILFLKPSSCLIGPGDAIVYPAAAGQVDFEGELAVVIGKKAKAVGAADALRCIFGYTCANDVTARDLQRRDGQWTRAKSFDTFCPLGPHIETDLDPSDVKIRTRLNGQLKQDSGTGEMIFDVAALIEFITEIMTLNPGDLVLTGTPFGVAPMQEGDEVEVEIEGIGTLKNSVA